jgi:extradiol dioxygenase family protein
VSLTPFHIAVPVDDFDAGERATVFFLDSAGSSLNGPSGVLKP